MRLKIRKGDTVEIISGRLEDKGKRGEVITGPDQVDGDLVKFGELAASEDTQMLKALEVLGVELAAE